MNSHLSLDHIYESLHGGKRTEMRIGIGIKDKK